MNMRLAWMIEIIIAASDNTIKTAANSVIQSINGIISGS